MTASKPAVVTAALAIAKGSDGHLQYHYRGAQLTDLPAHEVNRLVEAGVAEHVDPAAVPTIYEPTLVAPAIGDVVAGDMVTTATELARPAQVAPKAEWVRYAVASGLTADDAEGRTKVELIELLGG